MFLANASFETCARDEETSTSKSQWKNAMTFSLWLWNMPVTHDFLFFLKLPSQF